MKVATDDRGEVIHFAGFHSLSPALVEGRPALTSGGDPAAVRCGWEALFHAMGDQDLVLVRDDEDPGASAFVPRSRAVFARSEPPPGHGPIEHAVRFLRALRPPRKHE